MTVMSGATIAPALPAIRAQFADVPGVDMWTPLVLTLPALFVVLWAPVAGAVADRYGRKPLLAASVLLYVVAGGSGCVAPSLPVLLVGRACLGIAVGGLTTAVLALSVDIVEESARASFMGLYGAVMAFGGMTFVVVGGFLAELHWRAPFAVYLAAAPVLPVAALILKEPSRARRDAMRQDAAVPRRALAPIYAAAALLQGAFYVLPVQLPFLLDAHMGVGPLGAGVALATGALAAALMGLLYSRARRHASFQTLTAASLAIMGGGYVGLALSNSYWQVLCALAVSEAGFGLLMPNLNVWLSSVAPEAVRGRAFGGLTTCLFLGQFASPFASQPIAGWVGLSMTFGVVGAALLLVGVVSAGGSSLRGMRR